MSNTNSSNSGNTKLTSIDQAFLQKAKIRIDPEMSSHPRDIITRRLPSGVDPTFLNHSKELLQLGKEWERSEATMKAMYDELNATETSAANWMTAYHLAEAQRKREKAQREKWEKWAGDYADERDMWKGVARFFIGATVMVVVLVVLFS